ncbi:MAG: SOS response-associated peptidase family protein [Sphingomicrobium sp.]
MCNLYSMTATVDEMKRLFGPFDGDRDNLPTYNEIYPGRAAPVLRRGESGALQLDTMTWGFPGPVAAKGRPVTNVRNLSSPFWRSALERPDRRCLVPVTRFSEWSEQPNPVTGRKTKYWFGLNGENDPLFAFAGIWRPGEGGPFMAFLTCAPNATVGLVHPKAMPVMLQAVQTETWLDGTREEACALALPFADADMRRLDSAA